MPGCACCRLHQKRITGVSSQAPLRRGFFCCRGAVALVSAVTKKPEQFAIHRWKFHVRRHFRHNAFDYLQPRSIRRRPSCARTGLNSRRQRSRFFSTCLSSVSSAKERPPPRSNRSRIRRIWCSKSATADTSWRSCPASRSRSVRSLMMIPGQRTFPAGIAESRRGAGADTLRLTRSRCWLQNVGVVDFDFLKRQTIEKVRVAHPRGQCIQIAKLRR